ncbi:NnrU family protein [Erythrobacter sp. HKB08]|uniref:NnrU family protein n=1 Tax=Erythrobacter sp. HKB08 TaxID=2502843 RepID=UPI001008A10D|nr:NnrU family protein [Erythrobacter sp. HKB08]
MSDALISLIAASIAFVGSHFAMSHPLRAGMVRVLGEGGFMGVYSLVSAACMAWMYFAFKAVGAGAPPLWPGFDDVSWAIASLLTLVAMILFAGSLVGNPALPAPGAEKAARAEPAGVFKVTRHPMMWGFGLWAISHIVAAPTARTLVVAGAILVLALVGARLQDRKKEALMGEAWQEWESRTSYWPRWASLPTVGIFPLVGGIALWLGISWAHIPLGGWEAGIWRWL